MKEEGSVRFTMKIMKICPRKLQAHFPYAFLGKMLQLQIDFAFNLDSIERVGWFLPKLFTNK